ncbi:23649_t:CDS:2, partial [Racocetra persica]
MVRFNKIKSKQEQLPKEILPAKVISCQIKEGKLITQLEDGREVSILVSLLAERSILDKNVKPEQLEKFFPYEPEEGVFYGKFFGQANTDIIRNSQQHEIIIFIGKVLKDKNLFKQESKTEHSKENEKIKTNPQHTDFINIPYTQGEDMLSDTYGRAQLLKQQQRQLKTIEKEITKGRRIANED